MYSWEIHKLLEQNNWRISSETYIEICNSSPQLKYIKYDPYTNKFHLSTDDGYNWIAEVYYEGENQNNKVLLNSNIKKN